MEHGGQVEQFGIRLHAEPVSLDLAEEENPEGVVVDEETCGLLDGTSQLRRPPRSREPPCPQWFLT